MTSSDPRKSTPRRFELTPDGGPLRVMWADGHESPLGLLELRRACPCATCQHERAAGGPAQPIPAAPAVAKPSALRVVRGPSLNEISVTRIVPVGRYAVQLVWADGHDTGIYSFELLRSLCSCTECAASKRN